MHRLFVTIAAIVVAITAASSSTVFAQESDPASVMGAFNDAATDPEAAMQYLADDVTIRIIPPPPGQSGVWTGKEARGFLEFTKAQDVRRELVGTWSVDGNTVSGTVMVTNKDFTAWGVAPVEHTLEAVVEDGEIKTWTSIMSPGERERVGAARSAQQPGSMPSTGAGGSAGSSDTYSMFVLGGLALALGLVLQLARARTG